IERRLVNLKVLIDHADDPVTHASGFFVYQVEQPDEGRALLVATLATKRFHHKIENIVPRFLPAGRKGERYRTFKFGRKRDRGPAGLMFGQVAGEVVDVRSLFHNHDGASLLVVEAR